MATLLLILGVVRGGRQLRAARFHQPGSVIGISTLALPSCAVSPTLARLLRVSICVVPMEYPLVASRSGGITVLYRLFALFVLRAIWVTP